VIRYLAIAAMCAILYVALGLAVSHTPPFGIDLAGRALLGGPVHLALIFTESCYWYVLIALAIIMIAVAIWRPEWRARVTYAVITTLVTWQLSDVLKNLFRRPRPSYWRIIHEPTYAYSSGHAMFAIVVWWLWAWFIWRSELPHAVRVVAAPLLFLWGWGVLWSRLALGAHYVTDLIGGLLLGATMLSLASAIRAALEQRRARA
jgi:membrane-associated phospholipid phosphatase